MMLPPRVARARLAIVVAATLAGAGCQQATELELRIAAPAVPLLNPLSLAVSDFVLKDDADAILAAVSIGTNRDARGRLPLGPLDPALAGELRLDVMSGSQLVGLSQLDQVAVSPGAKVTFEADVRKPLVFVGSDDAPELTGPRHDPELLDPTTSTDLAARGIAVPPSQAAGFTTNGKILLLAAADGLRTFDTGSGTVAGPTALPFAPSLMAIAPKNKGVALLERGASMSRVVLYPDVPALLASPATAPSVSVTLGNGRPRAAHYSLDGSVLYVLVEPPTAEPCTGAMPPANQIIPITSGGAMKPLITMPSFVADFAIDRNGRLLLSEAGANRISTLSLDGSGASTKLYDAVCPTAMRLLGDQLFVVTNDKPADLADAFSLVRGRIDGSPRTMLSLSRPMYQTRLNNSSTRDDLTRLNLEFVSTAVAAYEIAISPDGNRAFIATRSRYLEDGKQPFDFVGLECTATVDIVEYGLHSVDLVNGTTSYEARSQSVVVPVAKLPPAVTAPCVSCQTTLSGFPPVTVALDLACPALLGDKPAGVVAAFSEQL